MPVGRADITPVLTLAADVRSQVQFLITAPSAGMVAVTADGPAFTDADGAHPIASDDIVIDQVLVPSGTAVPAGLPIAVAEYPGFAVAAEVTGADLLRFTTTPVSARAQVDGSGAPFDCILLDRTPGHPDPEGVGFVACRVPDDQRVIEGLTGVIAVTFPGAEDALCLPIEAVAGTLDNGTVWMATAGDPVEVPVNLGVTDGVLVQILGGLQEGDEVLVPSPTLFSG